MDLKIEHLDGLFVSEKLIPYIGRAKMRRIAGKGTRLYVDENDNRFIGATKCADLSLPKNAMRHLATWRNKLTAEFGSVEKVDDYVSATADYGTSVHVAIAEYFTRKKLDHTDYAAIFDELFVVNARKKGISQDIIDTAYYESQKDLIAILQFIEDYEVEPLSVEQMCRSFEIRTATPIDLPCLMNAKNYKATPTDKRRKILALLNIKTSKSSASTAHEYQCAAEWICWHETFGDYFPAHFIGTIRPTDWKDAPKYELKQYDITAERIAEVKSAMKHHLQYSKILDIPTTKTLSEMWSFQIGQKIEDGYVMSNIIRD